MVLAAPAGIGRETALTRRLASVPVLGELLTRPSRVGSRGLWTPAFHDSSFVTNGLVETKYALARAPGAHQAVLKNRSYAEFASRCGVIQRISDRARRGSAGRHADIAAAYSDHLGTNRIRLVAAGSRPHSRGEIAAIKNDPTLSRNAAPSPAA